MPAREVSVQDHLPPNTLRASRLAKVNLPNLAPRRATSNRHNITCFSFFRMIRSSVSNSRHSKISRLFLKAKINKKKNIQESSRHRCIVLWFDSIRDGSLFKVAMRQRIRRLCIAMLHEGDSISLLNDILAIAQESSRSSVCSTKASCAQGPLQWTSIFLPKTMNGIPSSGSQTDVYVG